MLKVSKDNFEEEVLKYEGRVLVKCSVDTGCGFCDRFRPVFASFAATHPEIKCVEMSKESLKSQPDELMAKYNPKDSYPCTLAFENGKLVNTLSGAKGEKELLEVFDTLQNISDEKLMATMLDTKIIIAQKEKELFEYKAYLIKAEGEIQVRQLKVISEKNG